MLSLRSIPEWADRTAGARTSGSFAALRMTLMVGIAAFLQSTATAGETITVRPREDEQIPLHNPDMGWVLYENYPLDPRPGGSSTLVNLPAERFDGVDHVAIMFAWSDVERTAGQFDFTRVDHAYDYWKARGKQIQLRMSTESLLWWNKADPPSGVGVPGHVLREMPADRKQVRPFEGADYTVVDASGPLYLRRLDRFLSAVAAHFDDRRPVTLVDLRGFGLWGEWHSGYRYASVEQRHAALAGVIDRWSAAFPNHFLALSNSYDPDGPRDYFAGPTDRYDEAFTKNYADFMRYSAFDHAMTKPNVTFRRDGVGGAVHSNERRLNREAFDTPGRGPMSCEFLGGYSAVKKGGDHWMRFMLDDALSMHPNYINLLGYQAEDALAFIREQPELVQRGLRQMGYRLVPTEVRYPAVIRTGQPFDVTMRWTNRGVGRAMRDYHGLFTLRDASGATLAACDAGPLGTDTWVKGKEYEVRKRFVFRGAPAGRCTLWLAVRDGGRTIELPLSGGWDGSYPLGEVTCEAAR